jgi:hypothetical protein
MQWRNLSLSSALSSIQTRMIHTGTRCKISILLARGNAQRLTLSLDPNHNESHIRYTWRVDLAVTNGKSFIPWFSSHFFTFKSSCLLQTVCSLQDVQALHPLCMKKSECLAPPSSWGAPWIRDRKGVR